MNDIIKKCPVCGSTKITIKRQTESLKNIFSNKDTKYDTEYFYCEECKEESAPHEIEERNDLAMQIARKELTALSIVSIIGELEDKDYNLSQLERALELPQRTFTRWKHKQDISASAFTLLKVIKTFPWIIKVAENKFEPNYANATMISEAARCLFFASMKLGDYMGYDFQLVEANFSFNVKPEKKGATLYQDSSFVGMDNIPSMIRGGAYGR